MQTGLSGLRVLVTGASGGIGRAVATAFGDEGCELVLHAGSRLDELREWGAQQPWASRASYVAADLRDEPAVQQLLAGADRIDIAIVNAGIYPAEDLRLDQMPPDRVREVFEVNLLGAMWTCSAFMRALAGAGPRSDGRGASLCLIGSTAGRFGEAGHCAYSASKAAMYGMLHTLKNELPVLDPYARINMIEPGWTVTPMAQAALDRPGMIQRVTQTMPVRQLARPEDIARAVLFVSSPALSRHVSGEVLTVAGGMEGRVLWSQDEIDPAAVKSRLDPD